VYRAVQVPALPRAFALDMLEFVLANHPIVFRKLPNFERLLGGRLASLLLTSLRAERSVEDEAGEMVERRLLMRTVVTVVRNFAQVYATPTRPAPPPASSIVVHTRAVSVLLAVSGGLAVSATVARPHEFVLLA
jgi:hypothetical protein